MSKNRPASEEGEAKQQPVGAVALFVTAVSLSTLAMAETMPKVYDCGDRKMEVFEPEGGILMEERCQLQCPPSMAYCRDR